MSKREQTRQGVKLEFFDLGFVVKDSVHGGDKTILQGVSGACEPGRLLALMGGSGAGKTTLLDLLACNAYGGKMQGRILVNGQPRNKKAFGTYSCYVSQRDLLYPSATVRECVTTSALLRLPKDMSGEEKRQRVEEVLKELELDGCANTLIGDELIGIKGVSGGQKRRVSLGIELVKDPAIIFADEPTSGLDSEVALSIIDALLMLARKSRTVVCTIHQPNSDITDMFDDLMLLAGGRCCYNGPWNKAVEWFGKQGFVTPTYKNPTDYFMSVIKVPENATRLADKQREEDLQLLLQASSTPEADPSAAATAGKQLALAASNPPSAAQVADPSHVSLEVASASAGAPRATNPSARGLSLMAPSESVGTVTSLGKIFGSSAARTDGAPLWYQVAILVIRMMRNWIRNPIMLASEVLQYVFISVFVGLMYCQFDDNQDGVYDRAACIWLALAIMSFTPSYTAAACWHNERPMLHKELKQRQFSITAYYLARTAVTVPMELVQCLVFVSIMYFFVGFQADAGKFFIFFVVLSIFQCIAESIGLLSGIITKQVTYAIVLLTFFLLLMLSFSGFLMTQIPVYFIWINKASFLTYSYTALMQSQLTGLWVADPNNPGGPQIEAITLMPSIIDNGLSTGTNIGILCAQWGCIELIKYFTLHLAHRTGIL